MKSHLPGGVTYRDRASPGPNDLGIRSRFRLIQSAPLGELVTLRCGEWYGLLTPASGVAPRTVDSSPAEKAPLVSFEAKINEIT